MNRLALLSMFLDRARLNLGLGIGEIFDYGAEYDGVKVLAELIARFQKIKIASLVLPSEGSDKFMVIPSGKYRQGFHVDNKLNNLYEPEHYLLVVQHELYLTNKNYVLIKIDIDGNSIDLYTVYERSQTPVFMTTIDTFDKSAYSRNIHQIMKLVVSELELLAGAIHTIESGFIDL